MVPIVCPVNALNTPVNISKAFLIASRLPVHVYLLHEMLFSSIATSYSRSNSAARALI